MSHRSSFTLASKQFRNDDANGSLGESFQFKLQPLLTIIPKSYTIE